MECVLALGADVTLLTEPTCFGGVLASACKQRDLVCTSKDQTSDLLAAIVYDPRVACELVPDLERWLH